MSWRRAVEPLTRPLFFAWSRFSRAKTLGVRVLVVDEGRGGVLLVKHTYLPGWWLPGGGVDRGETAEAAAIRELREETGLVADSRPRLISLHSNERFFPGDHVALYRVDQVSGDLGPPSGEIEQARFWPLDALPPDLNRGSADRLSEALGDDAPNPDW